MIRSSRIGVAVCAGLVLAMLAGWLPSRPSEAAKRRRPRPPKAAAYGTPSSLPGPGQPPVYVPYTAPPSGHALSQQRIELLQQQCRHLECRLELAEKDRDLFQERADLYRRALANHMKQLDLHPEEASVGDASLVPDTIEEGPGPSVMGPGPSGMMVEARQQPGTYQVAFVGPEGMKIRWDVSRPGTFDSEPLICPGRYNFPKAAIYELKLTDVPGRPELELYPTLEIGPPTPRTKSFLAHNAIPVEFTEEDFDTLCQRLRVTKVAYLTEPEFQELALAGVETLVSTRLDPGVDPIVEADRRGTILAIIRADGKFLNVSDDDRPAPAPAPLGLRLLPRPTGLIGLPGPPHVPLGQPEEPLPPVAPAESAPRPLREPAQDKTSSSGIRQQKLIYTSENLKMLDEWERTWMLDQPD